MSFLMHRSSLSILDGSPLLGTGVANVFSCSSACFFSFLMGSSVEQKFFI